MKYASKRAYIAINTFTKNKEEQESIRTYLIESPIGDEYDLLTPEDWEMGNKFEDWCENEGIAVWE